MNTSQDKPQPEDQPAPKATQNKIATPEVEGHTTVPKDGDVTSNTTVPKDDTNA